MTREEETCQIDVTGPGNRVVWEHVESVRRLNLTIDGADNLVEMAADTRLDGVNLVITGNGNRIALGASSVHQSAMALVGNDNRVVVGNAGAYRILDVICEDDGNEVLFGDGTEVAGATEFIAMERTRILVGDGCLFSGRISVRTGDSHSVVDLEGRRINCSEDVVFGNRVWVGQGVTVLKGARIPHSCVVGASAVVTRQFAAPNCVIAGNPATVVREGIDWQVARIPCE